MFLVLINSYSFFSLLYVFLQMQRRDKAPGIKYYILMQLIKLYYLTWPLWGRDIFMCQSVRTTSNDPVLDTKQISDLYFIPTA